MCLMDGRSMDQLIEFLFGSMESKIVPKGRVVHKLSPWFHQFHHGFHQGIQVFHILQGLRGGHRIQLMITPFQFFELTIEKLDVIHLFTKAFGSRNLICTDVQANHFATGTHSQSHLLE